MDILVALTFKTPVEFTVPSADVCMLTAWYHMVGDKILVEVMVTIRDLMLAGF